MHTPPPDSSHDDVTSLTETRPEQRDTVGGKGSATRRSAWISRFDVWITAAIVVLGVVVTLVRLPDTARNTIWAEDGALFMTERTRFGAWTRIFAPYDGYLHVVPRTVIELATLFERPEVYALAITVLCAVIVGLVTGLVYWLARDLVPWWPARVAVACLTFAVPVLPQEVSGNAANLHWFFLWASLWVFLYRARSWPSSIGLAVAVLLMALSEIQLALFAPLLLLRLRDRKMWPVAGALVIGLGAQILTLTTTPRIRSGEMAPVDSIVAGFFVQGPFALVTGSNVVASKILAESGLAVPIAAAAVVGIAIAYVLWRGSGRQRILVAAMLVGAVVAWTFAFALNPNPYLHYAEYGPTEWASFIFIRYAAVPSLLLGATLAVAASVAGQRSRRVLAVVFLIPLLVTAVVNVRTDGTTRTSGPLWPVGVETAELACEADPTLEFTRVPIAPLPNWVAEVDCDTLVSD